MSNADDKRSEVRIRRAPKIPVFLITGAGLGAIVAFILTASFPADPAVGFPALFGYFALYGVTGGVLLGGIVAVILDRRADRRTATLQATVERTETPEAATAATPVPDAATTDAPTTDAPGQNDSTDR